QLIRWVFDIQRATDNKANRRDASIDNKNFAELFSNAALIVNQSNINDSIQFYDISKLPHLLPVIFKYEEAVAHIKRYIPNMISTGGHLVMYNQSFKDSVAGELKTYLFNSIDEVIKIPTEIHGYYTTYKDFRQVPNAEIFIGQDEINSWLESRTSSVRDKFVIYDKLNLTMSRSTEPYIYKDPQGKIFMIQNTEDGDLMTSVYISIVWYNTRVNPGPKRHGMSEADYPSRYIFGISPGG